MASMSFGEPKKVGGQSGQKKGSSVRRAPSIPLPEKNLSVEVPVGLTVSSSDQREALEALNDLRSNCG
jgi:hypothetical protein